MSKKNKRGFNLIEFSIGLVAAGIMVSIALKASTMSEKINQIGSSWNTQGQPEAITPCIDDIAFSDPANNSLKYQVGSDCVIIMKYSSSNDSGAGQSEYILEFPQDVLATILVVAGGGSGGSIVTNWEAGGGGSGGLVFEKDTLLSAGSYTVKVGNGGNSSNGKNSEFGNDIVAIGGGRGGNSSGLSGGQGSAGGSGGGGGFRKSGGSGIAGQGNNGGSVPLGQNDGAGGGGAGTAGALYLGGIGLSEKETIDFKSYFAIDPIEGVGHYISSQDKIYFAGGGNAPKNPLSSVGSYGGGGTSSSSGTVYGSGGNALANTGGGGGAPYNNGSPGKGGSGIVIIRYNSQGA